MNQQVTTGIVLQRTNYGEADRILIVLTPDRGKLHLIAKGVRKVKSKLAGGIELFSVSDLTYLPGRSEQGLGTLVSARLREHFGNIVKDINRTMLGYELIKQLHKATEDEPEAAYFELLRQALAALDDATIDVPLIQLWFAAQLLRLGGHSPNLASDVAGIKLSAEQSYSFDIEAMSFKPADPGRFSADHIKFLRLVFAGQLPVRLQQVQGSAALVAVLGPLVGAMVQAEV